MRGWLWSNLLAAVVGGLVVAGSLLAFGDLGGQRTETVPISENAAPVPSDADDNVAGQVYTADAAGVVNVSAQVTNPTPPSAFAGAERMSATIGGSGFLISRRGYILTAYHLVEGASATHGITVTFDVGFTRRATLIHFDSADDVAVLQVSMHGVPAAIQPLKLGNSATVLVGDTALAIANPYGLDRTISSGIIAALQRSLPGPGDGSSVNDVIQTDMVPQAGASGSPLLNSAGSVIGLNTQLAGGGVTEPFALPIDTIRNDPALGAAIMSLR